MDILYCTINVFHALYVDLKRYTCVLQWMYFFGQNFAFWRQIFLEKNGFFQSVNLKIIKIWRKLPNFQKHKIEGKKRSWLPHMWIELNVYCINIRWKACEYYLGLVWFCFVLLCFLFLFFFFLWGRSIGNHPQEDP